MLIPQGMLRVLEYDALFIVTPTSRFGHASDSVYGTVEMLVENDQAEDVTFPFVVLNTDPGTGAEDERSVEPRVLNGSRQVDLRDDEIDEERFATIMVDRARAAGMTETEDLDQVRRWSLEVLGKAERTKRGRTRIKPGERRRIVLQQRIRVLPRDGQYTLEVIAPSPIATLATGGRVSMVALMPWEDDDVRVEILSRTEGFEVEQGQIKARKWVAWHWRNDPIFQIIYRYQ